MTNKEIQKQIFILRKKLTQSDYQAIKFAEGILTEEEYEPIKVQRQQWRNQINELESQIK